MYAHSENLPCLSPVANYAFLFFFCPACVWIRPHSVTSGFPSLAILSLTHFRRSFSPIRLGPRRRVLCGQYVLPFLFSRQQSKHRLEDDPLETLNCRVKTLITFDGGYLSSYSKNARMVAAAAVGLRSRRARSAGRATPGLRYNIHCKYL